MKASIVALSLMGLAACGSVQTTSTPKDRRVSVVGHQPMSGGSAIITVYSCTNDDDTDNVIIQQLGSGTLQATLTTESFGGSYPSFHYKVTQTAVREFGGLDKYEGTHFSLSVGGIAADSAHFKGRLSAPTIGVSSEAVTCKLNQSLAQP